MKVCRTCQVEKPESDFHKSKKHKGGLHSDCKECKNRASREYNAAHPEVQRGSYLRYRERHPERYREQKRRSEQKHKKARAAYRSEWRKRNPDKTREYTQRWVSNEENRRRKVDLSIAWNKAHPEKVRAISKRWRESHRDHKRAQNHRRKHHLRNVEGSYTGAEWQALCERYGNICLCCGASGALTVDHVIPVALGGTNYISNIQPLCLSCNCSKQDTIADYRY